MLTAPRVAWGDVPTWVGLALGFLTLVFAAMAAVAASRAYRIESERDRISAEERREQDNAARRQQAAMVSAWFGRKDAGAKHHGPVGGAFIRNASEVPVYQAHMTFIHPDAEQPPVKVDLPVVPPTVDAMFHALPGQTAAASDHRVRLTFTDAAGVRWMRDPFGRLHELRPRLVAMMEAPLVRAFEQFAGDFLATYGVTVEFRLAGQSMSLKEFLTRNNRHTIDADVIVCPHDWVGDLMRRGLIEPVTLSAEQQAALDPGAVAAFTIDGRLYGIPSHVDTLALIRNPELAPDPPATLEDVLDSGSRLVGSGAVTHVLAIGVGPGGDPYQIWPIFVSGGGWLFGRTPDGRWDTRQLGIGTPESIAALDRIRTLGSAGANVLRPSIDTDAALAIFLRRQTAYMFGSSGIANAVRSAGVPFAVTEIPPVRGGVAARPYSATWGFVVVRGAANREIAHDFIGDYVTRPDLAQALALMTGSPPALRQFATADATTEAYLRQYRASLPMPNVPEMPSVSRLLSAAEIDLISGTPADAVARGLARDIAAAVKP